MANRGDGGPRWGGATPETVTIYDGEAFLMSDRRADIYTQHIHGYFYKGVRFLSHHELLLDGQGPFLLKAMAVDHRTARYFMTNVVDGLGESRLGIIVHRYLGPGLHQDIIVRNYSRAPQDLTLSLLLDADFADMYQVKRVLWEERYSGVRPWRIKRNASRRDRRLTWAYRGDDVDEYRRTVAEFSQSFDLTPFGVFFRLLLPPKGEWHTCMEVRPSASPAEGPRSPLRDCLAQGPREPSREATMEELPTRPTLETDWDELRHAVVGSSRGLALLMGTARELSGEPGLVVAGIPWFVYYFGRDTLITAYETLPFIPRLALANLRKLASLQGTRVDHAREEQPGRIIHQTPLSDRDLWSRAFAWPYYGSVDSTILFLVLLSETWRWNGDPRICRELKENALRAMAWIDDYATDPGTGYVRYQQRSSRGLRSQGWKDSWDSIVSSDGRIATPPVALCEVQGYAYDAKVRMAEVAREVWRDEDLARRWEAQARDLRDRFNRDFWIPRRGGMYAMAIDGKGRRVDGLASNMGHLLWSGIVPRERVGRVVGLLFSPAMFTGWGVRTLASDEEAYNPTAYHRGTVWPFDSGLLLAGLARYGRWREVGRMATALVEASRAFDHCLPELYTGYSQEERGSPVDYPTACNPQAWSAGSILLALRHLLGLEPDPGGRTVRANPHLPRGVDHVDLQGVRAFGSTFDVIVDGGEARVKET